MEGYEGLPDEFDAKTDKALFQNANDCASCRKNLKQKIKFMKSDRHHCRRCGSTVCTKCWSSQKRLSKKDATIHNICDVCDFEVSNFQLTMVLE
jgi:hypothetical protein